MRRGPSLSFRSVSTPRDEWLGLDAGTRRAAWRSSRRLRPHPDSVVSAVAARYACFVLDGLPSQAVARPPVSLFAACGCAVAGVAVFAVTRDMTGAGSLAAGIVVMMLEVGAICGLAASAPLMRRRLLARRFTRLQLANWLALDPVAGEDPGLGAAGGLGSAAGGDGAGLAVRYAPRRVALRLAQLLGVLSLLEVAGWLVLPGLRLPEPAEVAVMTLFGLITVLAVRAVAAHVTVMARWVARGRAFLTVDAGGVHVPVLSYSLPWPDVAEVRLFPARYARRDGKPVTIIAFVPRDPAGLLAALTAGPLRRRRLARSLRIFGTSLSITDQLADQSADQILAAVTALAPVPVRRY